MVLANVAAAEMLETKHLPCMYRIHAPPSDEKVEALRSFLHGLEHRLAAAGTDPSPRPGRRAESKWRRPSRPRW